MALMLLFVKLTPVKSTSSRSLFLLDLESQALLSVAVGQKGHANQFQLLR